MNKSTDVIALIQSFPREYNAKEIKWQLYDMGIYLSEEMIESVMHASRQCNCCDDSGSCSWCEVYYILEGGK